MKNLLKTALKPEVVKWVQEITQFREQWKSSADQTRDFYASLKRTVIVTSAGASTRIEGAKLSDDEIFKKLEGLTIRKIHDRDEAEVAGYIDCKKYVFDSYKDLSISEHAIRSLHQMMMTYLPHSVLPPNQRGAYKNITNAVVRINPATGEQEVIFETTPPGPQTETAMRELAEDYNNFINDPNYSDLEVIAAFIVKFLAIHPFRDGNGRISRLLTDLCLLKQNYEFCMYASHEKIVEDNKGQYYVALRQTQGTLKTDADLNPWLHFFLKIIHQQTRYLSEKILPKKSGTFTAFEDKVFGLIQTHQPVTIGFLERESSIKRVTLKTILARLKEQGFIEMSGTKKGSYYSISPSGRSP